MIFIFLLSLLLSLSLSPSHCAELPLLFPTSGGWPVGAVVLPAASLAVTHWNAEAETIFKENGEGNEEAAREWWRGRERRGVTGVSVLAEEEAVLMLTVAADLLGVVTLAPFDSQCDPVLGLSALLDAQRRQALPVVVGAGCSIVSTPAALLAEVHGTPLISWGSTSPELSLSLDYPFFTRVVAPDTAQARGWVDVARYFEWRYVATIRAHEELHFLMMDEFEARAAEDGLTIAASGTIPARVTNQPLEEFAAIIDEMLLGIRSSGATVIFMACYANVAALVIERARDLDMLTAGYAWIGTDSWAPLPFWESSETGNLAAADCYGIIFSEFGTSRSDEDLDDFFDQLPEDVAAARSVWSTTTYDAVWMALMALTRYYADGLDAADDDGRKLLDTLLNTSLAAGISGPVSLDENGDRSKKSYRLRQWGANGEQVDIGNVMVDAARPEDNGFVRAVGGPDIVWPGGATVAPAGKVPPDDGADDTVVRAAVLGGVLPAALFAIMVVGLYARQKSKRREAMFNLLRKATQPVATVLASSHAVLDEFLLEAEQRPAANSLDTSLSTVTVDEGSLLLLSGLDGTAVDERHGLLVRVAWSDPLSPCATFGFQVGANVQQLPAGAADGHVDFWLGDASTTWSVVTQAVPVLRAVAYSRPTAKGTRSRAAHLLDEAHLSMDSLDPVGGESVTLRVLGVPFDITVLQQTEQPVIPLDTVVRRPFTLRNVSDRPVVARFPTTDSGGEYSVWFEPPFGSIAPRGELTVSVAVAAHVCTLINLHCAISLLTEEGEDAGDVDIVSPHATGPTRRPTAAGPTASSSTATTAAAAAATTTSTTASGARTTKVSQLSGGSSDERTTFTPAQTTGTTDDDVTRTVLVAPGVRAGHSRQQLGVLSAAVDAARRAVPFVTVTVRAIVEPSLRLSSRLLASVVDEEATTQNLSVDSSSTRGAAGTGGIDGDGGGGGVAMERGVSHDVDWRKRRLSSYGGGTTTSGTGTSDHAGWASTITPAGRSVAIVALPASVRLVDLSDVLTAWQEVGEGVVPLVGYVSNNVDLHLVTDEPWASFEDGMQTAVARVARARGSSTAVREATHSLVRQIAVAAAAMHSARLTHAEMGLADSWAWTKDATTGEERLVLRSWAPQRSSFLHRLGVALALAPEQLDRRVDTPAEMQAATDVYGTAVIVWVVGRMMARETSSVADAWDGVLRQTSSLDDVQVWSGAHAVRTGWRPPLAAVRDVMPERVVEFMQSAWADRPSDRCEIATLVAAVTLEAAVRTANVSSRGSPLLATHEADLSGRKKKKKKSQRSEAGSTSKAGSRRLDG